jgi:cytochrome c2
VLAVAVAAFSATRSLVLGDADRGKDVFRTRGCVLCHGINGVGGKTAPDLGEAVQRGFGPYHLAALIWNHSPAMWVAISKQGVPWPQLSRQDAADLFAYFFGARYFEDPGDPGRGGKVWRAKRCESCHGITAPVREGIQPVSKWQSLENPIALAQQMWNHRAEMRREHQRAGMAFPQLSSQELVDLLAYLRRQTGVQGLLGEFSPGSAEQGQKVFASKDCAACHRGENALEARPTRRTLSDFAASMWNHPLLPGSENPLLSYEEARQLVGYLVSAQFFEERGRVEEGRRVYEKKRCGACHDSATSAAPPRDQLAGRMTSFDLVAALWLHGPEMLKQMKKAGVAWPRLSGQEMADLGTYLHGLEFKRRAK